MGNKGFTLTEVMVAGVITAFLVLAIGSVFMASTRAVHTGYRHMDAFEIVRGAGAVMERDLTSAFVSRDRGDLYQFVGLPFGMMFIATQNASTATGAGTSTGLCKISYVVRQLSDDPEHPDPLDVIETKDGPVPCYALIRLAENDVDRLDNYPIGWTREWWNLNAGEDFPILAEQVENLILIMDRAEDYADDRGLTALAKADLLSAVKHELWLRMLRGNGPVRTPLGGWRPLDLASEQLPDAFAIMGKDPRDYVAATNIFFPTEDVAAAFQLERELDLYAEPVEPTGLLFMGLHAFDYGIMAAATVKDPNALDPADRPDPMPMSRRQTQGFEGTAHTGVFQVSYRPFWAVAPQNLQAIDLAIEFPPESGVVVYPSALGGEGSPLVARLPETVSGRFAVRFAGADVASSDVVKVFNRTFTCAAAYTPPTLPIELR